MGIDCVYRGYGFQKLPPSGDLADLEKSGFDLMLTAEDLEAHLQIEARRDPLAYLPCIQALCREEQRYLCHGRV